ncbi:Protein of unknown function DUF3455 (plasmid) [Gemmatirosa kalamazoonensis]|uniref:DUF3455 domain-containing protein n=1 Tax=Gemmatirosa kalamazoonensis TaxID=861299 RepID=W0RNX1_9BACT|nr:DUF3455 domain-containing protein [Gemmatirosa kalamazoonensis]AHG92684.1 Protein of unknown function DUF3455 [Gemmatirosa kalamazoonensis]
MITTTARALPRAIAALSAAIVLAACADRTAGGALGPVGPQADAARFPDLGSCQTLLKVPDGSTVAFHAFATGVQIYRWNGTSWAFVAPAADLFADASKNALVGTHFGGPTWQTLSGSRVVGTVTGRCTPNPTAIAWLVLDAVADGPGVFEDTKFIQRLNTVGGNAPSAPGSTVGEEARVPYTADYYFYRAP